MDVLRDANDRRADVGGHLHALPYRIASGPEHTRHVLADDRNATPPKRALYGDDARPGRSSARVLNGNRSPTHAAGADRPKIVGPDSAVVEVTEPLDGIDSG